MENSTPQSQQAANSEFQTATSTSTQAKPNTPNDVMDLQKLLQTAIKYKASDIYISVGIKPSLRIHGKIVPIQQHPILSKTMAEKYIGELMNDKQRDDFSKTLDIDFAINIKGLSRFRVNVFMQSKGIGAVLRIIEQDIKSIDELNLPSQLKKLANLKQGIVLVTGPTGQGKSTTLAAIINEVNANKEHNIITIEDPIEFLHANNKSIIQQREVGKHTKDYQSALKGVLREAADVILVGEMRDAATISLALTAAETGHLVLSTLHTSGAAKTVDRIIDTFASDQQNQIRNQLSESLQAVVWQQLLPLADGKGRTAGLEIMLKNNAISNLIREGKTFQIKSVLETNQAEGMQTMQSAIEKLHNQGFITEKTKDDYTFGLSI